MLGNEFRNTLHTLTQYIVGNLERFKQWCAAVNCLQQAVVRDRNKRIYLPAELCNCPFSISATLLAFKTKRLGSHAYT